MDLFTELPNKVWPGFSITRNNWRPHCSKIAIPRLIDSSIILAKYLVTCSPNSSSSHFLSSDRDGSLVSIPPSSYITGWEVIHLLMQQNPPPSLCPVPARGREVRKDNPPSLPVPSGYTECWSQGRAKLRGFTRHLRFICTYWTIYLIWFLGSTVLKADFSYILFKVYCESAIRWPAFWIALKKSLFGIRMGKRLSPSLTSLGNAFPLSCHPGLRNRWSLPNTVGLAYKVHGWKVHSDVR